MNNLPTSPTVALTDRPVPAMVAATTLPPVLLEQADLDQGILVMFNPVGDRAAYDPSQASQAEAEALLRAELGRRHNKPAGLVISIGGSLHLGPLPAGEPFRFETLENGRTRATLDTEQISLEETLRLLSQAQAQARGARQESQA